MVQASGPPKNQVYTRGTDPATSTMENEKNLA